MACDHQHGDRRRALAARPGGLAAQLSHRAVPNPPLLLAFAGWGLAAVAGDTAHDVGRAVFIIGLGVWAWEEAVDGVNWFRRLVGAGALIWIVAGLAGEL
jgi:hypothetical protein